MKTRLKTILLFSIYIVSYAQKDTDKINFPECKCVPYFQCNGDGSFNVNGDGIIDFRVLNSRRRECPDLEFCCYPQEMKRYGTLSEKSGRVEVKIDRSKNTVRRRTLNENCGSRNFKSVYKNHEDLFSSANFPWYVAVFHRSLYEDSDKICSGSLIHKQAVLVPAHCVIGKDKYLTVRAGKWNPTTNESLTLQYRRVESVFIHPRYTKGSYVNDMAVLKLVRAVDVAENVNTVCLPDAKFFDFGNCVSTGFIKKETVSDLGRSKLELIGMALVYPTYCDGFLKKSKVGKSIPFEKSLLCAMKSGNSDACTAEIGSPLACPMKEDSSRHVLVGLLVEDVKCDLQEISGIYVDVVRNRKWIKQVLSTNNLRGGTSKGMMGNARPSSNERFSTRDKNIFYYEFEGTEEEEEERPSKGSKNKQTTESAPPGSSNSNNNNFDELEKHYPNIYTEQFINLALAPKFQSPQLNPNIQF